MNWWRGFASRMERDAPVGRLTWFRVGGCARYLFRPQTTDQLATLVQRAREEEIPVKVLGGGANVLVKDDGFTGVVIRLDQPAFRMVDDRGPTVHVGAGRDLMPFCRECSYRGLAGLASLAGIPGTVGGAVRMNAGGRFGDISSLVRRVEVLREDGRIEIWPHDRIGFGYRESKLNGSIVLSAELELIPDDPVRVRNRYEELFRYKNSAQPMSEKSAGCVFKNPEGHFAGELIDKAGLKGACCGGAFVSDRHANFIVARSSATATDILKLIDLVRERVARLFNTELQLEIDVW